MVSNTRIEEVARLLRQSSMTNSNRIHIISRGNRWVVKKEGMSRASRILDSKKKAINNAKQKLVLGKTSKIVVHRKDGTVERVITK